MTLEQFVLFLALGKLVMYLARKAPYKNWVPFLKELFDCELCLGVWVYFFLSLVLHLHLEFATAYPLFSAAMTGAVASFVMWVWTDGWNAKFRIMYLE